MPRTHNADNPQAMSEPEVTMSAVKLDRDGNVVETIEFTDVEAQVSSGFLARLKEAARIGWEQGNRGQPKGGQ